MALPDELLEEIFLRLPPDEPACLVRASLASKLWLGLLTGAAFRGRYSDFHGAPPMLGFLLSWIPSSDQEEHPAPHFVSTVEFGARIPDCEYDSLDCRHGRVLLADKPVGPRKLAVWDPITGYRRELDAPVDFFAIGAALLCAVTGCEHHACHQGPFRVLLFGLNMNHSVHSAHAWVCSSETGEWSEPCSSLHLGPTDAVILPGNSVLFNNALYHIVLSHAHAAILKYDMGSNSRSLLDGPPGVVPAGSPVLVPPMIMAMEDGTLGVLDLKERLPIQNPEKRTRLIGFKENSGIIFVTTDLGIYEINLKSLEWKKLWKTGKIRALMPYMSFHNPPERATSSKSAH
ncbi:unnamed protein product [Alopecurus aequalis]